MNVFNYPTRILFGTDALEGLRDHIAARHARLLLVTDPGIVRAGVEQTARDRLRTPGVAIDRFDAVSPNPVEADVLAGAEVYRAGAYDAIIALGGGSAMDAAKAIAILARNPEPLAQYDDTRDGADRIHEPIPPIYAIPTTAGTGSEVGRSAVITIADRKTILFHPTLLPSVAALAPELTTGLPRGVTATTGVDALVHCLEAWFSPAFHPMADGIAQEGIRLVIHNLPQAVTNGADLDARGRMLVAATMGATAFQKGLGMIHSMAHPLSVHAHLHHGLANALLLPASLAFYEERADACPDLTRKLNRLARMLADARLANPGTPSSRVFAQWIEALGIPLGLAQHGVNPESLPAIADDALADPCHASNPIPVSLPDFLALLRAAV